MANSKRVTKASLEKDIKLSMMQRWDSLPNSTRAMHNSQANIGDSIESRTLIPYLGGGQDSPYNLGLMGTWPAQSPGMQPGMGFEGSDRMPGLATPGSPVGSTRDSWNKMRMCRAIYEHDGQVSSIIDLMADFATEGVSFHHKSRSVEKFYRAWGDAINLKERMRRFIIDILVSNNLFLYRVYATLKPSDIREMKSYTTGTVIGGDVILKNADGEHKIVHPQIQCDSSLSLLLEATGAKDSIDEIKKLVFQKIDAKKGDIVLKDEDIDVTKNRIPWKYISLNPLQMVPNINGSWSYLLTKEDIKKLMDSLDISFDTKKESILVSLPGGLVGKIKKTKHAGFLAEIELDAERLCVVQYNKFDWSSWAVPLLWKVVPTIMFKEALRSMEFKTAHSAINTVTLWKLGDHKEGLMPTAEHFERLADMLKAPSQTLNVLWSSAIDAKVIQPDISQIFDPKRWEEIRKEVTSQFGITQAVVTGEGGNFSSSYISVQGLLQRLETIRELMLGCWIMPEVKLVAKAMSFNKLPIVTFGNMSLRDEKAEKAFILQLADRGYLSDETLYEYMGRDAEVERRRIVDQKGFDKTNKIEHLGPFTPPPPPIGGKGFPSKKPNGRPPNSGKPLTNKRPSKPKNMATIDMVQLLEQYDRAAKDYMIKAEGKTLYKELSKDGKDKVLDLVVSALYDKIINDVEPDFANPTELSQEFMTSFALEVNKYIKSHSKKPAKQDVYNILLGMF